MAEKTVSKWKIIERGKRGTEREREYERSETNREEGKALFFFLKEAQRHTKPAVLMSLWHSECNLFLSSQLIRTMCWILMTNGQICVCVYVCIFIFFFLFSSVVWHIWNTKVKKAEARWNSLSAEKECGFWVSWLYLTGCWMNKQLQTWTERENTYPSIPLDLSVSCCFYTPSKKKKKKKSRSYHDITQF